MKLDDMCEMHFSVLSDDLYRKVICYMSVTDETFQDALDYLHANNMFTFDTAFNLESKWFTSIENKFEKYLDKTRLEMYHAFKKENADMKERGMVFLTPNARPQRLPEMMMYKCKCCGLEDMAYFTRNLGGHSCTRVLKMQNEELRGRFL